MYQVYIAAGVGDYQKEAEDTSNCLIFSELPTTISSTASVGYARFDE